RNVATRMNALQHLRPPRPAKLVARRFARRDVPGGAGFDRWLDDQWLRMDAAVDAELARMG
ncbi:MAG: hypothetical protein QNM02_11160, partial [Acidimicrobiia bacterium]|nr:hypothetical protein [Acidimicrobiia bacterium]